MLWWDPYLLCWVRGWGRWVTLVFLYGVYACGTVLKALARYLHGGPAWESCPLVVQTCYHVVQCPALGPPITRRGGSCMYSQLGLIGSST